MNAISWPTDNSPFMTNEAPIHNVRAIVIFLYQLYQLSGDVVNVRSAKRRADVSRQLLFPTALHLRFNGQRLDGFDPGDRFDKKTLVFGAAAETFVDPGAQQGGEQQRQNDIKKG